MDRQERIARRILASVYSWYTIEDGRAYVFLDSHSHPSYYVCRNAKNSYRVVKFEKSKFSSSEGRGILNAILVALKSGDSKLLRTFGDCIKYDRSIPAGKAVAPLLEELGMTLPEFERLFHTETDFTSGRGLDERRHGNWRLVFEKGTRNPEQVVQLLDRVDGMLGGFSKALSYGIVEIKNDMPPRVLADYNPKNDSMRVKSDSSDGRIYHSFIHELGHRLWFKLMSKAQRHSVKDRYDTMRRARKEPHVFNAGERVELTDGMVFDVVSCSQSVLTVKVVSGGMDGKSVEGETLMLSSRFVDDDIRRIDGKVFDNGKDMFPSEYSKTSVEEFFSECFAYWRAHELCERLTKFLEHIFIHHKQ